jgi:haloalkane dehalogenase
MPTRPDWFDATLLPYESHWLDLDGHRLHYLDVGTGPTLLMLHGNPTWGFLYRCLVAGLADRFRCVVPDHPGFGLSQARAGYGFTAAEHAEVVRGFVEALDLRDVTPIVQDWGGPIGLGAAVRDPDRYAGLVVGNTWAWPSSLWTRSFGQVMGGPLTGWLMSQRLNLFVGQMVPRMMRRRTLTPAERAMYAGPFPTVDSRRPVRVLPDQISAAGPFLRDLEGRLGAIAGKPSLLLWATGDIAFGDGERRRWQQVLTDRTDHTLHGAGHFWQDDAGEEAVAVIRGWFDDRGRPGHG